MKLAAIDIGTNSVKLLVANVEDQQVKNVLFEHTTITRLGQGVDKSGELTAEAMDRTLEVISDFYNRAKLIGTEDITAIATSAMRDAKNSDVFMQKVVEKTGLNLQIISGDEEAELTFAGACSDPDIQSREVILMDVGGGSTEFILGQNGVIDDKFSINLGCVRLTEDFVHSDPIDSTDLQDIIHHIISALYVRLSTLSVGDRELIGVGGTILTTASVHCNMEGLSCDLHKYILRKEDVVRLLSYLRRMTLEERKNVQGLSPQRADIIVAGITIFSTVMEILKKQEIVVSKRGLKYGILLKRASVLMG
jgi:exopolyphosphatase/guanosine-5'-triphosphate,3'-diphosphate pyrophosphatase